MNNYFRYPPETPSSTFCGCSCVSVGFTRVPPGSPYPLLRHPKDHHFTWGSGRILQTYTIVFITDGRGTLEFSRSGRRRASSATVRAGEVFIILPGMWHRYAPDPATGWVEHWVECRGPAFDESLDRALISADEPLIALRGDTDVLGAFTSAHTWAADDTPGTDRALVTLGLHILMLAIRAGACAQSDADAAGRMIRDAQALIMDRCDQPLNVQAMATGIGMGYSHFRQLFKERTGVSPGRFHQQARHRRAEQLLANSDKSMKEIADLLGFSSAFHFSKQFKAISGDPPSEWRERVRRSAHHTRHPPIQPPPETDP